VSASTELGPAPAPPSGPTQIARSVWSLVRFVLRRTFADPVRDGRLDPRGWPAGLRPIATVALLTYVLVTVTAVFASYVRGHTRLLFLPPNQTLPAPAVALVCVALILALTCLFTAGLHLRVPLRVATIVVTVAVLLYPLDWSEPGAATWVGAGLAASLLVIAALRWRRSFHWLEFVASLLVIGNAVIAHQVFGLAELSAVDPALQVSELTNLTLPLGALAVPAAVLAGAALVEITTAAATWTVRGAWSRLGRGRRHVGTATAVVLMVLIAGRVAQEVQRMSSRSDPVRPSQLVLGAAIAAAVGLACGLATWLADRRPTGDPRRRPDPDELLSTWSRCTPVLAVVVAVVISGQLLVSIVLRAFGLANAGSWVLHLGGTAATAVLALVSAVAAILAALVVSLRGWRTAGLLLMAFGTMYGASTLFDYVDLITTTDDILAAVTLAAVLLLGGLALRRRLTTEAQVAVAGVLLLNIAYRYRGWFTDPLTQLVSLTGVSAALLVGLIWRILTDNGFTRRDSVGFPQPSRVLIALGNAVVGVTFAAQVGLLGGRFDLDLAAMEHAGDTFLGFPLVLGVSFAGLSLAARGRTAGQRPGWLSRGSTSRG
jgi:hypothetical protein